MAKNDTTMPVLVHLSALAGMLLAGGFGWLGPLIFLLVKQDDKDVQAHAKEALNWQISLVIYGIISGLLVLVLVGFILLPVLAVLNVIFCIMAAVKASNGEHWKYPLTIRFLK